MTVLTDEEILKAYEEMKEHYGDKLPNPDHFPSVFGYYVKLFKTYHMKKEENENSTSV